jgi:hypothetical protein
MLPHFSVDSIFNSCHNFIPPWLLLCPHLIHLRPEFATKFHLPHSYKFLGLFDFVLNGSAGMSLDWSRPSLDTCVLCRSEGDKIELILSQVSNPA